MWVSKDLWSAFLIFKIKVEEVNLLDLKCEYPKTCDPHLDLKDKNSKAYLLNSKHGSQQICDPHFGLLKLNLNKVIF